LPAARGCQFTETSQSVFVRILRQDWLTFAQREGLTRYLYGLVRARHEIHLNPARTGVVDRMVPELIEVEIRSKVPIDAGEQVEVERGRHTLAVVVSPVQLGRVLLKVRPEQEGAVPPTERTRLLQQLNRRLRSEVADGRAGEVNHPACCSRRQGRQVKALCKVGNERDGRKLRVALRERRGQLP